VSAVGGSIESIVFFSLVKDLSLIIEWYRRDIYRLFIQSINFDQRQHWCMDKCYGLLKLKIDCCLKYWQ